MALSDATRLADFATGVGVDATLSITNLDASGIASVGSAITMYGSSGIVSATEYYGSGANLTGVGGETDITSCLFI